MTLEDFMNRDQEVDQAKLGEVAELANMQLDLEAQIANKEAELKELKKKHQEIAIGSLPELMDSLGLESFTTSTGAKVNVRDNYYASIAVARRQAAAEWLIGNGQDALVKRDVHLPFQAGDEESVLKLCRVLEENGFGNYSVDFNMHTGAVKAALKELIAEGVDVPFDTFGLRRVIEAKISL